MKTLINYPFPIYAIAALACLCIMIIVDFLLGAEAEHLNAWVIVNSIFGNDTGIGDSLVLKHLGLGGATILMFAVNTLLGVVLINLIKLTLQFFHQF